MASTGVLKARVAGVWQPIGIGAGSGGDVVGPGSSVVDDVVTFASTTGKNIKDSGVLISQLPRLNAVNTFTQINYFPGGVIAAALQAEAPGYGSLVLRDTNAPADNKNWQVISTNGVLSFRAMNDAFSTIIGDCGLDRAGSLYPGGHIYMKSGMAIFTSLSGAQDKLRIVMNDTQLIFRHGTAGSTTFQHAAGGTLVGLTDSVLTIYTIAVASNRLVIPVGADLWAP